MARGVMEGVPPAIVAYEPASSQQLSYTSFQ
jgi:hypothetical protein